MEEARARRSASIPAERIRATFDLLRGAPLIGAPSESIEGLRELPIRRTPFTLIYRVLPGEILIVHVRDQRARVGRRGGAG